MCTSSREDDSAQAKEEQFKQQRVSRGMGFVCTTGEAGHSRDRGDATGNVQALGKG